MHSIQCVPLHTQGTCIPWNIQLVRHNYFKKKISISKLQIFEPPRLITEFVLFFCIKLRRKNILLLFLNIHNLIKHVYLKLNLHNDFKYFFSIYIANCFFLQVAHSKHFKLCYLHDVKRIIKYQDTIKTLFFFIF